MKTKGKATPIDAEIGARVKEARKQHGLSQTQIGHHIGVSFQQVQKIESGKNRISAGSLYLLALSLKKDVSYFMPDSPL